MVDLPFVFVVVVFWAVGPTFERGVNRGTYGEVIGDIVGTNGKLGTNGRRPFCVTF